MAITRSVRDEPGTQREYETIFIMRGDTPEEQIASVNARVRGLIDGSGGKILRLENWGKRKLAYEVRKQLKGIYLYWRYLAGGALVHEIERNLRMIEPVVRYYTVKVDENVMPDARPSDVTEETFAAAASPGPDEEEIVTGVAAARGFADEGEEAEATEGEEGARAASPAEAEAPEGGAETEAATTATEVGSTEEK